jgi:hypothetical protein
MDTLNDVERNGFSPAHSIRKSVADLIITNPKLLEKTFRRHSIGEKATAETLESVSAWLKPVPMKSALVSHANDEMKHHRIFGALADKLIEYNEEKVSFEWIVENDRYFVENFSGDIVDFICDLFAGEVRSFYFINSYLEVLDSKSCAYADKIAPALRRIVDDECRHIGYTGAYLNEWMREGLDLSPAVQKSFRIFDKSGWIDVAAAAEFFMEQP